MKCADVYRTIDDHLFAGLSRKAQQDVLAHVQTCPACAEIWHVNDLLSANPSGSPVHLDAGAYLGRLALGAERLPDSRARWQRLVPVGLAALLCLALVGLWSNMSIVSTESTGPAAQVGGVMAGNVGAENSGDTQSIANVIEGKFVEGRDFTRLTGREGVDPAAAVVSVEFYFMYGCGHCFAFERVLDPWVRSMGEAITLSRVPVMFSEAGKLHASAYYAAGALGIEPGLHDAIFRSIHEQNLSMSTPGELAGLAMTFGVAPDEFERTLNSQVVSDSVTGAADRNAEYEIDATPTLIVADTYRIKPGPGASFEEMMEIAAQLVGEIRARHFSAPID